MQIQDALDIASRDYPAIELRTGQRLHVCREDGHWQVWLNTETADFDGLCVATGDTRREAVTAAIEVFEVALVALQASPSAGDTNA